MKTVGLWIDLQKAVIVSANGNIVDIDVVSSNIDSCRWLLKVWALPAAIRKRLSDDQLGRYYRKVSVCVLDARSIFIFGPGEAKGKLRRRLDTDHFTGTIVGFENADTMTESQIVIKARRRFEDDRRSLNQQKVLTRL